jgi:molecular chaperone GrpE
MIDHPNELEKNQTETLETNSEGTASAEATVSAQDEVNSADTSGEDLQTEVLPDEEQNDEATQALTEEVEQLRTQLTQQQQQTETIKSQYLRTAADFDNFRKRTFKEKEELEQQVKRNTINELLPVIDNFERARTQIKPQNDGEMTIHKSYQGIYKQIVDGLKRIGVSAMRPEGEQFDPNLHEAVMREPTNEYPEDTVIEQLVRGYMLGDRVLRHAMVKVAAPPEDSETPAEETATEAETSEST